MQIKDISNFIKEESIDENASVEFLISQLIIRNKIISYNRICDALGFILSVYVKH